MRSIGAPAGSDPNIFVLPALLCAITLVGFAIVWGWWAVVVGTVVLCVIIVVGVLSSAASLMTVYIFIVTLLVCLNVSIWYPKVPGLYAALGLGRYALMGLVGIWGLTLLRLNSARLTVFDFAWMALLALVGISVLYSVDRSLTVGRGGILAGFFLSVYALRTVLAGDARAPLRIINGLLLSLGCFLIPGIVLAFLDPELVFAGSRFHGSFGNPSATGGVCCMLAPIAFWAAGHYPSRPARIFFTFYSSVLVLCLVLAQTRNAVGAFLAGMFASYLYKKRREFVFWVPAVALLGIACVGVGYSYYGSVRETAYYKDYVDRRGSLPTLTGRIYMWEESFAKIRERPLAGYGFGTGGVVLRTGTLPAYLRGDSDLVSEYASALPFLRLKTAEGLNSHNSFLEIVLNLGLAGLIAVLFIIGSVARRLVNVRPQELPPVYRALPTYLAAGFVAGLVNGSFEASLFSTGSVLCIVFWFIVVAIFCLPGGESARATTMLGERTAPYRPRERVVVPMRARRPIPRESNDGR